MTERKQNGANTEGTGGGGYCGRVSRVAVFVAVALFVCLLTVGFAGTAAAQTTTAPDCGNVGYTQDGGSFEVTNVSQLQCMGNASTSTSLTDSFVLTQDIDASGTDQWNSGAGFKPIAEDTDGSTIGFQGDSFEGTFDGQNNEIKGLFIDRQSQDFVGLFGRIGPPSGEVRDVGVVGADVTGRSNVGVLAGENGDRITGSYSTGSVSTNPNDINNYAGGLVGTNQGTITESYSTANASSSNYAGGLAGLITNFATVEDSYATGKVSADNFFAGGLGGDNRGSITRTYATGDVSAGSGSSGGLLGDNSGTVSGSYWDVETTGQSGSAGSATDLTTSEMKGDPAKTNMSAFDFTNTWDVVDNSSYSSYPFLRNNRQEPAPGLTTKNSAPTADAGGPYTVNEGGSVTLDGSGSSDPDGDSLSYEWDLDGDGTFETTGVTPTFDASGINGTTSVNVELEVEDNSGNTDTDSTTVDVNNVAPSVSADNGAVTVDEGQTATNTGSYSDPVDTVSLSASTGTVTDEGSGTWSWSYPTSDGPDDGETITITADDGEDTSSVDFDLTVNNVVPAVTIDSLPSSADEGDTVTLDASFSDPGDDTHTATIDWGDGTTTDLSESEVDQTNDELSSSHTYADNASYTVTVTVTDDDGGSGGDSATADVSNVAPTVTIDSLSSMSERDENVTLNASFSDPSSDDTHTATIDWGDGTTESVGVDQSADKLSATHAYADGGSYTVTVTVEDDDGGTDSAEGTVNVQTDCLNPREISRGQEDQECPRDRVIERGGSREELDREAGRRNSDTSRRDRSRGERRNRRGR